MLEIFSTGFPIGWYLMAVFGIVLFAITSAIRKTTKDALKLGLIGLMFAIPIEIIGIYTNLWNYTGGNWPVILWPLYVLFTMVVYQTAKVAEQKKLLKF